MDNETALNKIDFVCSWPRVRIPDTCRNVEIVIGIDEAGRGPVLGSLIYTAAFWPLSESEAICKLGFDDSKQLKEGERDRFFDKIRSHPSIGWVIEEITAKDISKVREVVRTNHFGHLYILY
jgi:ribonuclease H2 subunit A